MVGQKQRNLQLDKQTYASRSKVHRSTLIRSNEIILIYEVTWPKSVVFQFIMS